MSATIVHRLYGYDNISAGNAWGQERNQSQFFPYTPGNVDPTYPDRASAGGTLSVNLEISGNSNPAAWGYGAEIPALFLAIIVTWAASIFLA